MRKAVIIGTGGAVPAFRCTNDDLAGLVETNDEWIRSRTGIRERRISDGTAQETAVGLAARAAKEALADAGLAGDEVDLILVATMTPDSFMPSTACEVQRELGAVGAAAFDLSAACSGFVFALATAQQFLENGSRCNALVIGVDVMSKVLDWSDRSTCVLFGDGAGAAVLQAQEGGYGILASHLKSSGMKGGMLQCAGLPARNPFVAREQGGCQEGTSAAGILRMDGGEVFKFAVKSMTAEVREVVRQAGLGLEDIRMVVPHQANQRIVEQAARMLRLPEERFFLNLGHYGNTSAGSIGLALNELRRDAQPADGDKLVLVGLGGGMTAGAILLNWHHIEK